MALVDPSIMNVSGYYSVGQIHVLSRSRPYHICFCFLQEFFDNAQGGMTKLEGTHELFAVSVEWERQKVSFKLCCRYNICPSRQKKCM